jgi:hypothetical protein
MTQSVPHKIFERIAAYATFSVDAAACFVRHRPGGADARAPGKELRDGETLVSSKSAIFSLCDVACFGAISVRLRAFRVGSLARHCFCANPCGAAM